MGLWHNGVCELSIQYNDMILQREGCQYNYDRIYMYVQEYL